MVFGGMALNSLDVAYRDYSDRLSKLAEGHVDDALSIAKSGVKARGKVEQVTRYVWQALVAYAEGEKIDTMVVGTRGLLGFKKLFLGSVSSAVVSHAHCPVLVVR